MWFKPKPRSDAAPVPRSDAAPVAPERASVRMESRPDGRLIAVTGASRSGKSTRVARDVRKARRLLVWDYPKGEWAARYNCRRVTSFRELAELTRPGARPARIAFHPGAVRDPAAAFDAWAWIAFGYGQAHGAPIIAEELSSVTHPGKAPAGWGNLCRMVLGYGSDLYAVTQRPAESDKTALGNASIVHVGRFTIPDDRVTMARYLGASVAEVAALQPFEYLERDAMGRVSRGRVTPIR